MNNKKFSTLILAAGKGTRMKSDLVKVLHPVAGQPMLSYAVDLARLAGSEKIVAVIGHQSELVEEQYGNQNLIFVYQREQMGTGHAVLQARDAFFGYDGAILILCGDVPLLKPATIQALMETHVKKQAAITVLTTLLDDPFGYGRMVKDAGGGILKIVEHRDATEEEKKIREINTGIYCAESRFLFDAVVRIGNHNAQREYYFTDIFEIARCQGVKTASYVAVDPVEVMGINTPDDLERATRIVENRLKSKAGC
jgi:UDP-N-acetylglucosamine diphosphorylase/glucosamine-1-phosphate N-acetyltransferase